MPKNNVPKPLYSNQNPTTPAQRAAKLPFEIRKPFPRGDFGKRTTDAGFKDYSSNLSNQNPRTRVLQNGKKTPFTKIPNGNNAVKAAPLAVKGSGIGATAKGVAVGAFKFGAAVVGAWTLAIYGTVEGIFTRRAGVTDEERKRAISQYYPGEATKLAEGTVPFEGGQIPGAAYVCCCNWNEPGQGDFGIGGRIVYGEVTNIECWVTERDRWTNNHWVKIDSHDNDGNPTTFTLPYSRQKSSNIDPNGYWITVDPYGHDGTGDSNPPAVGEVISPRITPRPQPPFPADETIIDDSPVAYSREPLPRPSRRIYPVPLPDDNNADIDAVKAQLDRIEKRLIDSNPGGKDGQADSATSDQVKADSIEQVVKKQGIEQTNLNNGLDLGISNPIVDIPAVNPSNAVEPIIRSQKYSVTQLDRLKRKRRVEEIELERATDKVERKKKLDKLNNQIQNISGAKISPPPTIEIDKQIEITDGSQTGKDVQPETKTETKQAPKESEPELLGKIAALFTVTPLLNKDGFKEAVEESICDSTQGGCLKSNIVDPLATGQNNLTNALQGLDLGLLTVIDGKLGDAIPGGIGGYLKKAWELARVDKIINMATLITSTHNAAMLSRNLGQTIGDVSSEALKFLKIKNPTTGADIDVNEVVGNTVKGLIESLVPADIRTNVSATWLKVNRIHTAAVGVASAISQTKNAVLEVQEITTNWVAEIGNNMQEQGLFEEDSYPWMNDKNDFTNPYAGFLNKVNNVEGIVESAGSFINSVTELQDSTTALGTSKEELAKVLEDFSKDKQNEENEKITASSSPSISNSDLIKHEA